MSTSPATVESLEAQIAALKYKLELKDAELQQKNDVILNSRISQIRTEAEYQSQIRILAPERVRHFSMEQIREQEESIQEDHTRQINMEKMNIDQKVHMFKRQMELAHQMHQMEDRGILEAGPVMENVNEHLQNGWQPVFINLQPPCVGYIPANVPMCPTMVMTGMEDMVDGIGGNN